MHGEYDCESWEGYDCGVTGGTCPGGSEYSIAECEAVRTGCSLTCTQNPGSYSCENQPAGQVELAGPDTVF